MTHLLRTLVAAAALALPNWSHISVAAASLRTVAGLSQADRVTGSRAADLAGHSPVAAMHWLSRQRAVQRVEIGRDAATLDIHFSDGQRIVILPPTPARTRISVPLQSHIQSQVLRQNVSSAGAGPSTRRAAVLEPFATELDLGVSAGQDEVNALRRSGFTVDVFRNEEVTVALLESLSQYSVIYFQTHAGLLANGDAVVVTGEKDQYPLKGPHQSLYGEHSLITAFVAGDPKKLYYDSITANFVNLHMGVFPNDSVLFLNGCATLSAYTLISAFHSHNLSTVISWDGELYTATNDASGIYIMARLALGETVTQAVDDARIEGIGTSIVGTKPSRLGFDGDGSVSLKAAFLGAQPTPIPTPTAMPTPVQPRVPLFSGRLYGPARES